MPVRGACGVAALAALILAGDAASRDVPNELIVRFHPGTPGRIAARALDEHAAREIDAIPALGFRLIRVPPGRDLDRVRERLARNPNVESAQANPFRYPSALPDDPLAPLQWAVDRISASQLWAADLVPSAASATVVIAVIDSGVMATHEELAGRVLPGTNLTSDDPTDTQDNCNHGTHVAGIAAAAAENGKGIAGIAWRALILPVKVISYDNALADCGGSEFDIAKGVVWASDNGADVINMSLGSCLDATDCGLGTKVGAEAMEYAFRRGAVLVAAMGNEATATPSYPAAYPFVVGVTATDPSDGLASFSNFGEAADLAAPGVGLWGPATPSAGTSNLCEPPASSASSPAYVCRSPIGAAVIPGPTDYCVACGTSVAAPVVSGAAAVLMSQDASRTPDDVLTLLYRSADQPAGPGWNPQYGYGRLNLLRALSGNRNPAPASPSLGYAVPNPFSPDRDRETRFVVYPEAGAGVDIEVFDLLGHRLWNDSRTAQQMAASDPYAHSPLTWNGKDLKGRRLPNGIYLVRLTTGTRSDVIRVVIAR